jgi:hypothetical protein
VGCLVVGALVVGVVVLVVWVVAAILNWVAHVAAWIGFALLFPAWAVGLALLVVGLAGLGIFARDRYGYRPIVVLSLSVLVVALFVFYAFGAGFVSVLAASPLRADRARLAHFEHLRSPLQRERAAADDARRRIVGEERRYYSAERLRLFLNPPRRPATVRKR